MNNIIRQIFKYFGMYICKLPHNFDVSGLAWRDKEIESILFFPSQTFKTFLIRGSIVPQQIKTTN